MRPIDRTSKSWLLAALGAAAFGLAACAGDDPGSDPGESLRDDVDRKLELAFAEEASEPELRDVGQASERSDDRPPAPPSPSGASDGASAPADEAADDPEAPPIEPPRREPERRDRPEDVTDRRENAPEARPRSLPSPEAVVAAESPLGSLEESTSGAGRATVAAGTTFEVELQQRLSTAWSRPGDAFMARLTEPIRDGEREIVPAGAEVLGEVVAVEAPDGSGKNGSIEVRFTRILVEGESHPIDATASTEGALETRGGRDGGGAGGKAARGALTGAILGRVLGGSSKGAVIGAGAGAAAGAASGGGGRGVGEAILATGATVSCTFDAPLVLPAPLRDARRTSREP